MKLKPSANLGAWLSVIVVNVWIVNGVFITYLLMNVDSIVNGQLYGFGLQFSQEWAAPYWMSLNLIYVFLGVSMVLSLMVFGYLFMRVKKPAFGQLIRRRKKPLEVFVDHNEPTEEYTANQETLGKKEKDSVKDALAELNRPEATPLIASEEKLEGKDSGTVVISCPTCHKFFGRPLIMLDFSSGKTRLVNICPYCNQKLGEVPDKDEAKSAEVGTQG